MTTHAETPLAGSTHSWNTRAVHAGKDDLAALGLHAPPIDLSTTYPSYDVVGEAERLDEFAAGHDDGGPPVYGRVANPTVRRFENALAELEGAEAAVAFASGMAALSACLLAQVAEGKPEVVGVRPMYGTTDHLLESGLLGNSVRWVTPDEAASAITDTTGLVVVESPANPTLTEVDLRALADACGAAPLLVDNTFATPVLQRPLTHGASLVLHSATKYLGGHGDVMGGVIACSAEFARSLRQVRFMTGGVLHPMAGYELLRGLATLPVRVRAASATAAELARRLAEHPRVTRVHYPRVGGAMVSFETSVDPVALVSAVRLITPAVSLGSVDSLIQHPASLTHRIMDEVARKDAGISPDLVRLSVGLEDVDDLWQDLLTALTHAAR
ncbi:aminotransferase class I/II-fold pyridoxal phosphate-dependent enzyme [Promicromonospora sp. NPDC023805]|uniref:trans-sulfuration enzyme family protein n=1 Tax=Promicromonospora sp. NPDC023805 TaxID=3154696 RepID=UPI0033BFF57B